MNYKPSRYLKVTDCVVCGIYSCTQHGSDKSIAIPVKPVGVLLYN